MCVCKLDSHSKSKLLIFNNFLFYLWVFLWILIFNNYRLYLWVFFYEFWFSLYGYLSKLWIYDSILLSATIWSIYEYLSFCSSLIPCWFVDYLLISLSICMYLHLQGNVLMPQKSDHMDISAWTSNMCLY